MPDAIGALTQPQQMGLHGSVDNAMSALGGMDSEGFLNLLVAQLKYQSPMDPQDPGDLMTQTAALAQLDASQQLLQIQQRNMGLQQAVAASNLLGTEVTGIGPDNNPVSGTVESVRYTPAGPMLNVEGVEVRFGDVTELRHGPGEVIARPPDADDGSPGAWDVIAHPPNAPDGTPGTWEGPLWSSPSADSGADQSAGQEPEPDAPAADDGDVTSGGSDEAAVGDPTDEAEEPATDGTDESVGEEMDEPVTT